MRQIRWEKHLDHLFLPNNGTMYPILTKEGTGGDSIALRHPLSEVPSKGVLRTFGEAIPSERGNGRLD